MVFNPNLFNKRVDIIGVGASGSKIAVSLAKLGVVDLHVWDFDSVESHNIANQIYGKPDIGRLKVDALADHIKETVGTEIIKHPERVETQFGFGEYVFLLTDSMDSRAKIMETLRYNPRMELCIETRMGADEGRIYALNPGLRTHYLEWRKQWYPDEITVENTCREVASVGPTADLISGYAVWLFMRFVGTKGEFSEKIPNELMFVTRPNLYLEERFF